MAPVATFVSNNRLHCPHLVYHNSHNASVSAGCSSSVSDASWAMAGIMIWGSLWDRHIITPITCASERNWNTCAGRCITGIVMNWIGSIALQALFSITTITTCSGVNPGRLNCVRQVAECPALSWPRRGALKTSPQIIPARLRLSRCMFSSQAAWYRLPSCLLNGPLGLLMDAISIHEIYGHVAWKHNDD